MTDQCAEEVFPKEQWGVFHPYRCKRNAWKDGFCKQHHPETKRAREEESSRRWEEKIKSSPLTLLQAARERIKELEEEVAALKVKP